MNLKNKFAKLGAVGVISLALLGTTSVANASTPVTPQTGLSISATSPMSKASMFAGVAITPEFGGTAITPDRALTVATPSASRKAIRVYTRQYGRTYSEVFNKFETTMYSSLRVGTKLQLEYPHRISWFGDKKWTSAVSYVVYR